MPTSSRVAAAVTAAVALAAAPAAAQLMIPDSGAGDRIMLFSKVDGSLIDLNWITDIGAVGWVFTTPKEAIVVNNEIWVSDQFADAIHRFDLATRTYLSSITTMPSGASLDNIRGMGFDGGRVYLTQYHGTQANRGIVSFSPDGTPVGFFQAPTLTTDWYDVEPFQGDLLISTSSAGGSVTRYTTTGEFVSVFAPGIVWAQQVSTQADGSIITVSTIAAAGIEGVYHFNADGTLRRFIDTEFLKQQIGEQVPRGAYQLDDGGYLISTSRGIYKAVELGPNDYMFLPMATGVDGQFINPIPEDTACPADWNDDGQVNSQDISAFITSWLDAVQNGTLGADFNNDGFVNSTDISAFITAWLDAVQNGC